MTFAPFMATRGAMCATFTGWPEAANDEGSDAIRGRIVAIIAEEYRLPIRLFDPVELAELVTPEAEAAAKAYFESVTL